MSSLDINSVLSQIRSLNQQIGVRPSLPAASEIPSAISGTPLAPESGFGTMLKQGVAAVADSQNTAGKLQQAFELGDPNTDLATVMVASAKAQVSFRAMVEVRNRVVSAYQDVMNMPL